MKNEFRVVIADDHPIFRAGLKPTIESVVSFKVVFDAADGEAALSAASEYAPDVIVLDLNMPKMTWLEAAARLSRGRFEQRRHVFNQPLRGETTAKITSFI